MDQRAYLHDPTTNPNGVKLETLTLADAFARAAVRTSFWHGLEPRIQEYAGTLTANGIGAGDVVGLSLPNTEHFVAAHVAIARLGAVSLTLHVAYSEAEIAEFLRRTNARYLIDGHAPTLAMTESAVPAPIKASYPFVLAPTSGTESTPKICMHSHEGLLSNAAQVVRDAGFGERDVILPASGFTHLFGLLGVHAAMLSGATLVAAGKFDPERCVEACVRENVTVLWAVPAQFIDIVAVAEKKRASFPTLREVRTAGAPLSSALAASIARTLGVEPLEHWGMSEVGAGIVGGRPLDGAQVHVGEDGELHYRRADMFRGYLDDPHATARAITADGFLRTGDLATLDAEGRVRYAGRIKDIINRGGMKVSALELETQLAALPAIRQLAVVPVESPRLGERAALVCTLAPGASLTIDDVREHLERNGFAKFKWPEYVLVVDEMPLTPTGKVAKHAVRTLAAKALA